MSAFSFSLSKPSISVSLSTTSNIPAFTVGVSQVGSAMIEVSADNIVVSTTSSLLQPKIEVYLTDPSISFDVDELVVQFSLN